MKRLILAIGLATALLIDPASASHNLFAEVSVNPTTKGVPAAAHTFTDFGTAIPASATTHLPAGHLVNEEGAADAPLEGELVGDGNVRAKFIALGCFFYSNVDTDLIWDDLDNTAEEPTGSVARIKVDPTVGTTFYAYVVEKTGSDSYQSGAHYDIVVPSIPSSALCSGTDVEGILDTFAYSQSGGSNTDNWVAKNPATAGTYTGWGEYTDTSDGHHDDSDTYTITNN